MHYTLNSFEENCFQILDIFPEEDLAYYIFFTSDVDSEFEKMIKNCVGGRTKSKIIVKMLVCCLILKKKMKLIKLLICIKVLTRYSNIRN
jgi:hypothetical protein